MRAYLTQTEWAQRLASRVITSIYLFAAETLGAVSSGFYREGPRVHPRVVSFLTTHSKLVAALPVPASIPELSVVSSLLRERLVRINRQAQGRVEVGISLPDRGFLQLLYSL